MKWCKYLTTDVVYEIRFLSLSENMVDDYDIKTLFALEAERDSIPDKSAQIIKALEADRDSLIDK